MNIKFQIKTCPTCGSRKIKRVVRDIARVYKGKTYIVPKVEFYDCPNCGEKVYDHAAMMKIQSHSPAFRKTRTAASFQQRRFKSSRNSPISPA